jgi:hypothetical protein
MTTPPFFPGFDGLMTLSRREGVDIKPTLLRVLTDLYVQANAHSGEEERQFVELTSRLIDEVDGATRTAVRARLAIYPGTPVEVLRKLGLTPPASDHRVPPAPEIPVSASAPPLARTPNATEAGWTSNLSMPPKDASEINDMFFRASSGERAMLLHNLQATHLREAARIPSSIARRAVETLEMAAFAQDVESFTLELAESLILPWRIARQVVNDTGGEPLACAAKALDMPSPVFQRVLLFLKSEVGSSVHTVFRLARLYDLLSERAALIMLAAWRGSTLAVTRARFRPGLYDDERNRARPAAAQARPTGQQPGSGIAKRTRSEG